MTQPPPYPGTPEQPEETSPPPGPAQPPAYGAPYGAPQQPPAYGGPYAPHPYGGSVYPGGPVRPGGDQPSKGMAITALVLSFVACTFIAGLVAIVLAIVVLVRGKDGRNHGKGFAISAIVVSVVVMALTVLGIVGIVAVVESQSIDNLRTGKCINADDLADVDADYAGFIDKVSCSEPHDGEIVGTADLTAAQASNPGSIDCLAIAAPELRATLESPEYLVFWLTEDGTSAAGDAVACVVVDSGGGRLTGKVG